MEYKAYRYGLVGYANLNNIDNSENKKFIIGHYFFFNKTLATGSNIKQKTVSISTTKVDYIALSH